MNVLVVEDDPSSLKLAHLVLTADGANVNSVDAAHKVLAAIERDKPEVILLDLTLPDMDGLALVRKLKGNPQTKDIPIVAITAFPNTWSREKVLAAGCSAYIVKPMDTRSIAGELRRAAQGS